jgi:hypothetical protein
MKKLLLTTTSPIVINTFGKKLTGKVTGITITNHEITSKNDTIIKVIYKLKVKGTCIFHKL